MSKIKTDEFLSKTPMEQKWWIEARIKCNICISLKKTPETKNKALSCQATFTDNKKQQYAMYMSYINCLQKEAPSIKVISVKLTEKNKLIILGLENDAKTNNHIAISVNMISKKHEITYDC